MIRIQVDTEVEDKDADHSSGVESPTSQHSFSLLGHVALRFLSFMPAPNVDRQISATGNGTASSVASVSLSRDHIKEALQKSRDGGATLDLAHKHLTDVGEDGAEELASVGQEAETEGDSTVVRYEVAASRSVQRCLSNGLRPSG